MPLFDLPLAELQRYRPEPTAADDFDTFWSETLELTRKHELNPKFTPVDFHLETLDVLDTSFSGWNGERVAAWLLLPRGLPRPLPAVVHYLGYGGAAASRTSSSSRAAPGTPPSSWTAAGRAEPPTRA